MNLNFRSLHPSFAAEVSTVKLGETHDPEVLAQIRAGMDRHAVLVFRDQTFTGAGQIEFAQRLDGEIHAKTGAAAITKNRFGNEALSDISNIDENGEIFQSNDRRRMYALGNRLWHTDASFQNPAGRYSMLFSIVVVNINTSCVTTATALRTDVSVTSRISCPSMVILPPVTS